MDNKQVQVNIRIAENSAVRLKELAESSGLKLGPFVERLIAGYRPDSNALQNDSNSVSWQAVAEELRELIASQDVRLNALEVAVMSGITDSSGKARVTLQPADLSLAKPVETESDSPSHPAESLSLPPQSQDDFEQLVKDTYKECGEKLRKTMEALREKGHRIGQGRLYKILGKKAWAG